MSALAAVGVPAAILVRVTTAGLTLTLVRSFRKEVRDRAEVEPTFERYLAYVLVLAVVLLIWLGGAT